MLCTIRPSVASMGAGAVLVVTAGLLTGLPTPADAATDCMKRVQNANASMIQQRISDKSMEANLVKAEDLCQQGKAKEANLILAQIEKQLRGTSKN
ncbi:MAG: hypothetical protein QNJ94_00370 [Alphaproteobacteria bacterium]|nr:hypothetical protein [Alphaproteobacteria bacterium]